MNTQRDPLLAELDALTESFDRTTRLDQSPSRDPRMGARSRRVLRFELSEHPLDHHRQADISIVRHERGAV